MSKGNVQGFDETSGVYSVHMGSVARIFASGGRGFTVIFSHPQYRGYTPKLTTRTLPRPIKNSYQFDFLLSWVGALTTYLSK